jgi:hypothetical protein
LDDVAAQSVPVVAVRDDERAEQAVTVFPSISTSLPQVVTECEGQTANENLFHELSTMRYSTTSPTSPGRSQIGDYCEASSKSTTVETEIWASGADTFCYPADVASFDGPIAGTGVRIGSNSRASVSGSSLSTLVTQTADTEGHNDESSSSDSDGCAYTHRFAEEVNKAFTVAFFDSFFDDERMPSRNQK